MMADCSDLDGSLVEQAWSLQVQINHELAMHCFNQAARMTNEEISLRNGLNIYDCAKLGDSRSRSLCQLCTLGSCFAEDTEVDA